MNNVIRKELRRIQEMLSQLEKQCTFQAAKIMIQDARISLVRADYYDFLVNPKKKYVEPKSDFIMSDKVAFFEEFIALCRKHGFCIVSDDPYEGIDVAPLDSDYDEVNLSVLEYLKNHEC